MRSIVLAITLLLATVETASACQMPVWDSKAKSLASGTGFGIDWRFVPTEPTIGEFFAIEFALCSTGATVPPEYFKFDAIMPAHKHGMNFQPKITMISRDIYRIDGLMFHMPGTWQLIFERRLATETVRLTTDVKIE